MGFRGVAPVIAGRFDVPLVSGDSACVACGNGADVETARVEGYVLTVCRVPSPCLDRAGVVRNGR